MAEKTTIDDYEIARHATNLQRTFALILAKSLSDLRLKSQFKKFAPDLDWSAFLGQPEIGVTRSAGDKMVEMYDTLVRKYGIPQGEIVAPMEALLAITKLAKEDNLSLDEVTDLIEAAKVLSASDFKKTYVKKEQKKVGRNYEYLVMKKCKETGTLQRIYKTDPELAQAVHQINQTVKEIQ